MTSVAQIFGLSAAVSLVGCALPQVQKTANPPDCDVSTLRSRQVAVDQPAASIVISEPELLRLSSVLQFEAPCASQVRAFKMGLVQLTDGTVLEPSSSSSSGYAPTERGRQAFKDPYDLRTEAEKKLPRIGVASPLASAMVNSKKVGGDFVGVWHLDGSWVLQTFSQRSDRSFTKPKPILRSLLPVKNVQYFPSPDAPSGGLFVVQEQLEGRARALGLHWFHRQIFDEHGN